MTKARISYLHDVLADIARSKQAQFMRDNKPERIPIPDLKENLEYINSHKDEFVEVVCENMRDCSQSGNICIQSVLSGLKNNTHIVEINAKADADYRKKYNEYSERLTDERRKIMYTIILGDSSQILDLIKAFEEFE